MSDAGINTKVFLPHSTRAAASTAAKAAGNPLANIMRCAGWSRATTFERYYHKPIISPQIGDIICAQGMCSLNEYIVIYETLP